LFVVLLFFYLLLFLHVCFFFVLFSSLLVCLFSLFPRISLVSFARPRPRLPGRARGLRRPRRGGADEVRGPRLRGEAPEGGEAVSRI